MARRICVVTGSRAEYGLLYWILSDLRADPAFDLQLLVTGMHLAPEFGLTVREIERDGFDIARRVEMLVSSDSPGGTARSIGLGVLGMTDALEQLRPDIVLVLGDRFEILAAVQVCLMLNIPVAHIAGGDTTEGAFDESIRHAVTKMSHVHFVTNEAAACRVRQLGEDPGRVHLVGSPGLDYLRRKPLLDRQALEESLQAPLGPRNLLVTFHPVTLLADRGTSQLAELLAALDEVDADTTVWLTQSNADTGGRTFAAMVEAWVSARAGRAYLYQSLGQVRYLSLMAVADAVVGNSSSGLYEAPSLGVATVNIGDRQEGRLIATSIVNCAPEKRAIHEAIEYAIALDCSDVVNPYGDGHTSERVLNVLRNLPPPAQLIRKRFHTVEPARG